MFIKILKFIILVSFIKVLFYNEKIIPFFCWVVYLVCCIMESQEVYVVEKVLATRKRKRGQEFLIKWEGYPE